MQRARNTTRNNFTLAQGEDLAHRHSATTKQQRNSVANRFCFHSQVAFWWSDPMGVVLKYMRSSSGVQPRCSNQRTASESGALPKGTERALTPHSGSRVFTARAWDTGVFLVALQIDLMIEYEYWDPLPIRDPESKMKRSLLDAIKHQSKAPTPTADRNTRTITERTAKRKL
jgi:hypothetical protein